MKFPFSVFKFRNGAQLATMVACASLAACNDTGGNILLQSFGMDALLPVQSAHDVNALLTDKKANEVAVLLGPPVNMSTLGATQFVQYRTGTCLSRPQCGFRSACQLTITFKSDVVIATQIQGAVIAPGPPPPQLQSQISTICNEAFWRLITGSNRGAK